MIYLLINRPELIPNLFVFLSENLKDPKTLSPSSSAISELCSYNKKFVIENIDDFLTRNVNIETDNSNNILFSIRTYV